MCDAQCDSPEALEDRRRIREATIATGRVPTGGALEKLLGRRPRGSGAAPSASASSETASQPEFTSEVAANAVAIATECARAYGKSYVPPAPKPPVSKCRDGALPGPSGAFAAHAALREAGKNASLDYGGVRSLISAPSSTDASDDQSRHLPSFTAELAAIQQSLTEHEAHASTFLPQSQGTLPEAQSNGLFSSISAGFSDGTLRDQFSTALPPSPRGSAFSHRLSGHTSVRQRFCAMSPFTEGHEVLCEICCCKHQCSTCLNHCLTLRLFTP